MRRRRRESDRKNISSEFGAGAAASADRKRWSLPASPLIQTDEPCALFKFYRADRSRIWLFVFTASSTILPAFKSCASANRGPTSCKLVTGTRNRWEAGTGIARAGLPAKFTATVFWI